MTSSISTSGASATYRVKLRKESSQNRTNPQEKPTDRVPRVARLLALAHKIDGMIRSGELKNWADAARLVGVTRARMTQIANLILLAPEIQEIILQPSAVWGGRKAVNERELRGIVIQATWSQHLDKWKS